MKPGDYGPFYRNLREVTTVNADLLVTSQQACDVSCLIEMVQESSLAKRTLSVAAPFPVDLPFTPDQVVARC